jgi:hypothetical protein
MFYVGAGLGVEIVWGCVGLIDGESCPHEGEGQVLCGGVKYRHESESPSKHPQTHEGVEGRTCPHLWG